MATTTFRFGLASLKRLVIVPPSEVFHAVLPLSASVSSGSSSSSSAVTIAASCGSQAVVPSSYSSSSPSPPYRPLPYKVQKALVSDPSDLTPLVSLDDGVYLVKKSLLDSSMMLSTAAVSSKLISVASSSEARMLPPGSTSSSHSLPVSSSPSSSSLSRAPPSLPALSITNLSALIEQYPSTFFQSPAHRGSLPPPPLPTLPSHLTPLQKSLFDACASCDLAALSSLLASQPASLFLSTRHPVHGGTCLHVLSSAASPPSKDAQLKCLSLLLSHPPLRGESFINLPSKNGSTALHWSSGDGNSHVVDLLLECGADPSPPSYTWLSNVFGKGSGQTPLHWASESNALGAAKALLDADHAASAKRDDRGKLPSEEAEKNAHFAMQEMLEKKMKEDVVFVRIETEKSAVRIVD